jgi:DNA-binding IclR family transcriptional regulator
VLSVPQASRLLGIDQAACERILAGLAAQGRLRRRDAGSYGNA